MRRLILTWVAAGRRDRVGRVFSRRGWLRRSVVVDDDLGVGVRNGELAREPAKDRVRIVVVLLLAPLGALDLEGSIGPCAARHANDVVWPRLLGEQVELREENENLA